MVSMLGGRRLGFRQGGKGAGGVGAGGLGPGRMGGFGLDRMERLILHLLGSPAAFDPLRSPVRQVSDPENGHPWNGTGGGLASTEKLPQGSSKTDAKSRERSTSERNRLRILDEHSWKYSWIVGRASRSSAVRSYRVSDLAWVRPFRMSKENAIDAFRRALLAVALPYFSTALPGDQRAHGERIFAYELYHQLRIQMKDHQWYVHGEFRKGLTLLCHKSVRRIVR